MSSATAIKISIIQAMKEAYEEGRQFSSWAYQSGHAAGQLDKAAMENYDPYVRGLLDGEKKGWNNAVEEAAKLFDKYTGSGNYFMLAAEQIRAMKHKEIR